MENTEKENKELREELARARKQNENSTRKIEELQQTLNEIPKRMGGHSGGIPSSCISTPCKAAERGDATSARGEGETDMCCGGEDEARAAVGSKRKSPSSAQPSEDAENHAKEPKRPRPGAQKIDAIEEMVNKLTNKLTNKTERMFKTLLTRLYESDV
ncbi:hypothetical protein MTO96_051487 [Rhipicephalus appendiculatus]